jgi:tetratricopeptide (TPR) repeat protein
VTRVRALATALLLLPGAVRAQGAKPAYDAILESSDAALQDPAAQKRALEAIDAEITRAPKVALSHYVRGKILSRLKNDPEALLAYDEAVRCDPRLANAHYNAGTVLARLGRLPEAAARFDRALEIEPLADAAFNAGQAYYGLKDFKTALTRFQRSYKLAPGYFNAAKRTMQTQMALGLEKDAWKTREQILLIWQSSKDPEVRPLKEYMIEEFDLGSSHVLACETFVRPEDLAYIYVFRVFGPDGKALGSVQLETSAVIREGGVPYLIGITLKDRHQQAGIYYKDLPKYSVVREAAKKVILEKVKP